MAGERYYSDDDIETGLTLDQLENLSDEEQLPYILYWWRRNFEDPANETPYVSADGGYQYVLGGPYDALTEIEAEFSDAIPFERLQEIAKVIEGSGTFDWAPGPDHPDHRRDEDDAVEDHDVKAVLDDIISALESGSKPNFGDEWELQQRKALAERVQALEEALRDISSKHGGMGHNNPPKDELDPDSPEFIDAREASAEIANALEETEPAPLPVARSAKRLVAFTSWLAKKADLAADEAAKTVGKGVGGAILLVGGIAVTSLLSLALGLITQAIAWLSHVAMPF